MKKILLTLFIAVLATMVIVVSHYRIDQDMTGWKNIAQTSSEPNDMLSWMILVREGLEKHNMTQGYAALVFKKPDNDMGKVYQIVKNHVEQAQVLTTMDRKSPEYQTGLDNLRGSIRELDLKAGYFWDVHEGLKWWFLAAVGWALTIFLFLWEAEG